MAPTQSPGGRALSAAGESEALRCSENERAGDGLPRGDGWKPLGTAETPGSHGAGTRVSPDPLRTTDRYRLVTPFKLKL